MTATQKKMPALRFPEFEGEWEERQLGKILTFLSTNSFSRSQLNYQGGAVKNIHYGDIHTKFRASFDATRENIPFVNQEVDLTKIAEENYCKVGDLIVADASEDYKDVGKAIEILNLDGHKVLAGLHTLMLRDIKNQTARGFKAFLMQTYSVRLQIMKMATGVSVLGITKGNLSKVKIRLPSFPEQQKIAAFLSVVDARLQQLTRQKTLLEQYKKGVMQQIFSQQIRFRNDRGGEFPLWEEKGLGEIAKIYDGTHQTPNYVESGVPFYSVEHVTKNDFTDTKFISEEVFAQESKRVKLEKGDILMTRIGDIGTAKYIHWDVRASFYVSLAMIKQSPLFESMFLNQYIGSIDFQRELHKRIIHVAFPRKINLGEIGNCLVKLPSLPEQQKIADFLAALDRKIEQVRQQLDKMNAFKKGLLQQMFV